MLPPTSLEQVIPQLRDAVGPVILISGVGLLLLTMTNRLGRAIDRARQMKHELTKLTGAEHAATLAQIKIIYCRAKIIRHAILWATTSALLATVLMVTLFLTAWFHGEQAWLVGLILIACLAALCASLVALIVDVNLALHALKLELGDVK